MKMRNVPLVSKYLVILILLLAVLVSAINTVRVQAANDFSVLSAVPPFSGTIFIDPDIITSSDPTTFLDAVYTGQGLRTMFDRRVNNWVTVNAYLFNATFDDGLTAEIQVNPEFGDSSAAMVEAKKYGEVIGRLPYALRTDVHAVWIHKGTQPFGGGNNSLLIHTGQADLYAADGILEETLAHEAAHTSLDANHAAAPGWLAAQTADGNFISTYAQDNPDREDIAESFLPYFAVRLKSDRISQSLADTITQTIPNRLAYFDNQSFNLYPLQTFFDVPRSYSAWNYIESLYSAGITGGCKSSPMTYCPGNYVTRSQMAVFLLRAKHTSAYVPPAASGIFSDVPASNGFAPWIEQLYTEGVTGGCTASPLNYCPGNSVTRAQMAIFLLRAEHGSDYNPPAATGIFADVPADSWTAPWIEQLYTEGVTGGCTTVPLNYCPSKPVTRAQMAIFLVRTFNLPMP